MKQKKTRKKAAKAPIPTTNEIKLFFHCRRCLEQRPADTSPRNWAQLECGWSVLGFQVWCKRHECNVIHVDFEGAKHPAVLYTTEELGQLAHTH